MCSSLYQMLFLETGVAYVAPSVGVILATASLIDVHLQGYFYCTCISCSLLVSCPWWYQHLLVCTSFICLLPVPNHPSLSLSLSAPEICGPLRSPPESQCNIYKGVESSQRRHPEGCGKAFVTFVVNAWWQRENSICTNSQSTKYYLVFCGNISVKWMLSHKFPWYTYNLYS